MDILQWWCVSSIFLSALLMENKMTLLLSCSNMKRGFQNLLSWLLISSAVLDHLAPSSGRSQLRQLCVPIKEEASLQDQLKEPLASANGSSTCIGSCRTTCGGFSQEEKCGQGSESCEECLFHESFVLSSFSSQIFNFSL